MVQMKDLYFYLGIIAKKNYRDYGASEFYGWIFNCVYNFVVK